jgi:Flp pilus assembly pilin Flp
MLDMIMAYARAAFAEMRDREEGQTLVEYALILVFVSIASIAALTALGLKVGTVLDSITAAL